jgi:L-fuculose-phosphate aldolase
MIEKTRKMVAKIAEAMLDRGLTDGTSGNVSVLDQESNLLAITPSGIPYKGMTADQIPVLNLAGERVWGEDAPSSEYRMHIAAVQARPNISAVIHTHSHFAIAMACIHQALPAITVDMAAYCGVEAPVVSYKTPGTDDIALIVSKYIARGYRALLLANHGTLFVAPEAEMLIDGAEALELAAMGYIRGSTVGTPKPIPPEEVEKLLDLVYGKKRAV